MWGSYLRRTLFIIAFAVVVAPWLGAEVHAQSGPDYDIVYVRQPRYGDNTNTIWPEAAHPGRAEPGADLVLLHPMAPKRCSWSAATAAVTDPTVSFDGQWIYYAYFYDLQPENINPKSGLSHGGSDIFRINVASQQIEQLTFGEFTPNLGAGIWDESNPLKVSNQINSLDYGIVNLGPSRCRAARSPSPAIATRHAAEERHEADAATLRHGRGRLQRHRGGADDRSAARCIRPCCRTAG